MQPTIVNNVETLSNLPWLFHHGLEAYRSVGTEASPGTRLIALSGHVNQPGVYEIAQGTTTFRDVFEKPEYGGGIRDGHELKMFIPGGASAPWFFPEQIDLPMEGRAIGRPGLDARFRRHRRDGRDHRRRARRACGSCASSPGSPAASARRVVRARRGRRRSSSGSSTATVGPTTSTCCSTSPTTSAPGRTRSPPIPTPGLDAVPFPPRQTTICPLGPSSVAPITSAHPPLPPRVRGEDHQAEPDSRHLGVTGTPRRRDRRRGRGKDAQPCLSGRARSRSPIRSTVTVDGVPITAQKGELVIDACERNGTYIPRFCYHPRMNPVGMCRMCLVEIDIGPRPGAPAELHDQRHART